MPYFVTFIINDQFCTTFARSQCFIDVEIFFAYFARYCSNRFNRISSALVTFTAASSRL